MVDENRLREWVEQKLDEGVDPDRIRQSLEDTGHDPSVVDEVQDPFQGDVPGDVSEEHFESSGDSGGDAELSSDIGASGLSPSGDESAGERTGGGELGSVDTGEEADEDREGGSRSFSLPSVSVPELPLWPALVAAALLLGVAGFIFVPWGSAGSYLPGLSGVSVPSVDMPVGDGGGQGARSGGECGDAGVRINSVYSRQGRTVAEVLVTRNRVEVVLEVYRSGEKVGSTVDTFKGVSEMVVEATGDRAVARMTGCFEFRDSEVI